MKSWRGVNVAITGGGGFIGRHLVNALYKRGANIMLLLRDVDNHAIKLATRHDIRIVTGDIRDPDIVHRFVAEARPKYVFHLAAQAQIGYARRTPLTMIGTNIMGGANILEACRQCDPTIRIVWGSSDKAYGSHIDTILYESTPPRLRHIYDATKMAADMLVEAYIHQMKSRVVIVRTSNVYGPGDLDMTRLIPYVVFAYLSNQRPILRSLGEHRRDYLFIDDAINAYITVAEKWKAAKNGMTFNFSTQRSLAVNEIVSRIGTMTKKSHLRPIIKHSAQNETINLIVDCSKAMKQLDWSPSFAIGEGLYRTIEWAKAYHKKRRENDIWS